MRKATTPLTDKVLSWAVRQTLSPVWRYLIATAVVSVIAVVRMLYITALLPWLPFIPGVILLALLLGAEFGFYATILAAILAAVTIAPGQDPRQLTGDQWSASLLFVLIMALMVFISGELRAAYRRNVSLLAQSDAREADLALLNAELGHRLKNQLTVVQAIVTQVIRRSASLETAERAVSERLSILGRASDLLLKPLEGRPELEALIAMVIAPLEISKDRISCSGGKVRLRREAALALALALHELATNAVKYGALSNDRGRIEIIWHCREDEDGTAHLTFRWREIGGPEVQQPVRRGFGTALLDRALSPYLKGKISTDFRPDGLVFEIDARVVPAGPLGAR